MKYTQFSSLLIILCITLLRAFNNGNVLNKKKEASTPNITLCGIDRCGYRHDLPIYYAYDDYGRHDPYILNRTAEHLKEQGFHIKINEMYSDAIWNFSYHSDITNGSKKLELMSAISALGGQPSIRSRSYYMAVLGVKEDTKTEWYCGGVVIHKQWILTAAHCFINQVISLNVVRLGEYDWGDSEDKPIDSFPKDYIIDDVIIHPNFIKRARYHDVALVRLKNPFPNLQHSIVPICLPWNRKPGETFVGNVLTLSAWGATSYSADDEFKSILQEVNITVFNATVCEQSYPILEDYEEKFPKGMKDNLIMCAGSKNGVTDACKGDSGSPLVYKSSSGNYVLAAIVSTGFGCGLKQFPGIYIPIYQPMYLQWIKEIAFSNCNQ